MIWILLLITRLTLAQLQCGNSFAWLNITTQDQILQLSRNNCTFLNGSLALQGPNITNSSLLKGILGIEFSLEITSTSLVDLSGFSNLAIVGDNVFIQENANLTSLNGLNSLRNVSGGLVIQDNPKLSSIAGLGIRAINPSRNSSNSMGLSLINNPQLTSLDGLGNLTVVGNILRLENLISLSSLSGLSKNAMSVGNVTLFNLPWISDLSPLAALSSNVQGSSITISYVPLVYSLSGLQGFVNVTNLVLLHNAYLNDTTVFSKSKFTGPLILVDDNGSLCKFDGISNSAAMIKGSKVYDTCGVPTKAYNGSYIDPLPGSVSSTNDASKWSLNLFFILLFFNLL